MVSVMHKNMYNLAFFMFKSLPGLDLRRFVYPHTFSTNGTSIRLILTLAWAFTGRMPLL